MTTTTPDTPTPVAPWSRARAWLALAQLVAVIAGFLVVCAVVIVAAAWLGGVVGHVIGVVVVAAAIIQAKRIF